MLFFFHILTIIFSILMIISINPINSVLFLIGTFISVSMIFLIWNIEFIALIFIIIYVGAIAVLFLFIVMMINIKKIEKDNNMYLTVGIILISILLFQLFFFVIDFHFSSGNKIINNLNLYFFEIVNKTDETNRINLLVDMGILLFKIRPFLLILVGLILFIAMIGAIFLTNMKKGFSMKRQLNQLSKISTNVNYVHFYY